MLKRRALPYIIAFIGACTVATLFVFSVKLIEKTFLEGATQHEHPYVHGDGVNGQSRSFAPNPHRDIMPFAETETRNEQSVYEFDSAFYDSEFPEWLNTGKLTPRVEEYLKMLAEFERKINNVDDVIQRIVTPDGTLSQVIVPRRHQYEEGDAILKSEIVDEEYLRKKYPSEGANHLALANDSRGEKIIEPDGTTHPMPDEYYDIEDLYEREEYANKFGASIELGISMEEVEQKIASGEIDVSLHESQKRLVENREARLERYRLTRVPGPERPSLSGKAPVKVSFLPDDGEGVKPGWSRKRRQEHFDDSHEAVERHGIGIFEYDPDGVIDNTWSPNDFSASPEPPSEHREQLRTTPSKQAMEDFSTSSPEKLEALNEAQFSPEERMKASFNEKLSPWHKGESPPFLDAPEEELRKPPEQHHDHDEPPPPSR